MVPFPEYQSIEFATQIYWALCIDPGFSWGFSWRLG